MTLAEEYHARHKARLIRMGAPHPYQEPIRKPVKIPPPPPHNPEFCWENMWFFDLVTEDRPRSEIRIRDIQMAVCRHFKISILDLLSGTRVQKISVPRHIAMYLCKEITAHSYAEIGRRFGGRDHTTVIHAHRKIEGLYGYDLKITANINAIKRVLG